MSCNKNKKNNKIFNGKESPLRTAIACGNEELVYDMLAKGACVNEMFNTDENYSENFKR
jgi:hypothetical protein